MNRYWLEIADSTYMPDEAELRRDATRELAARLYRWLQTGTLKLPGDKQ